MSQFPPTIGGSLPLQPLETDGFVKRRLSMIKSQLNVIKCTRFALREAYNGGTMCPEDFKHRQTETFDQQNELEQEEKVLLGQGIFIQEYIHDNVTTNQGASIDEVYKTWRQASSEGQKVPKNKRLAENNFASATVQYLGGERNVGTDTQRFCPVLGIWISKCYTKCVPIVPKPFAETRSLAYVFGVDDAALSSIWNGIVMDCVCADTFANGWMAIVPDGSVESTPTQWKVVLLNNSVKRRTVSYHGGKLWRLEDLHNRKLTFQNEHRPARRYLYFHYIMSLMRAEFEKWEGYRENIPSGHIWASPSKPEGYFRESVLRGLARRVVDEDILSEDLIVAGTFKDTDPPTGIEAADKLAELELGIGMRLECERALRRDDESEDSEDEEEFY